MTKDELIQKIGELLGADSDLNFLSNLKKHEIEILVAHIRDRLDQVRNASS
jgi:hypothetical protein